MLRELVTFPYTQPLSIPKTHYSTCFQLILVPFGYWALGIGHRVSGIGHWALGIGHGAWGIGHWAWGIGYWAWGIGYGALGIGQTGYRTGVLL